MGRLLGGLGLEEVQVGIVVAAAGSGGFALTVGLVGSCVAAVLVAFSSIAIIAPITIPPPLITPQPLPHLITARHLIQQVIDLFLLLHQHIIQLLNLFIRHLQLHPQPAFRHLFPLVLALLYK